MRGRPLLARGGSAPIDPRPATRSVVALACFWWARPPGPPPPMRGARWRHRHAPHMNCPLRLRPARIAATVTPHAADYGQPRVAPFASPLPAAALRSPNIQLMPAASKRPAGKAAIAALRADGCRAQPGEYAGRRCPAARSPAGRFEATRRSQFRGRAPLRFWRGLGADAKPTGPNHLHERPAVRGRAGISAPVTIHAFRFAAWIAPVAPTPLRRYPA
jgi:hypothetical protein